MADANWDEKSVFLHALELPADQREAYLSRACPDDAARRRILTLISHHDQAADQPFNVVPDIEHPANQPTQIDEFKIIHRIGAGGMGIVFLAEDLILNRKVALKLLPVGMADSERALARFRQEARSAAALQHPAIVPVFKFVSNADHQYIVSEFVDGPTLATLITDRRTSAAAHRTHDLRDWHRRSAQIVATIAEALESAHRAGIVHRDVKPSNILMDPALGPRLTDFGIAKQITDETRSEQTELIGSCHYMSPEQASIAGARIDQRTDIFSLGVVLYELLSSRLPFDGPTIPQVLRAVVECSPARLRTLDRQIPIDLETICRKAMEREPGNRYQSAAHLAADLRSFLDGRPILARPPGPIRRLTETVRVHPKKFAAAGVLGLVLVIALLYSRVQADYDARMAWLSIKTELGDARATVRRVKHPTDSAPEPLRELGPATSGPFALTPGQYRITIQTQRDNRYGEYDLWLPAGRTAETAIHVIDAEDPSQKGFYKTSYDPVARSQADSSRTLLARLAPTTPGILKDMVLIEAGEYQIGVEDNIGNTSISRRSVKLEAFYIDQYEVSNADYKAFTDATGYPIPAYWEWNKGYPEAFADHPVITVSCADAMAYAAWRNKRLPTAEEWEAASRAPVGGLYPWSPGDPPPSLPELGIKVLLDSTGINLDLCKSTYEEFTSPVRSHPEFSTKLNLFHTMTNVAELTSTVVDAGLLVSMRKGGAWFSHSSHMDLSIIATAPASSYSNSVGFRCARSAHP